MFIGAVFEVGSDVVAAAVCRVWFASSVSVEVTGACWVASSV